MTRVQRHQKEKFDNFDVREKTRGISASEEDACVIIDRRSAISWQIFVASMQITWIQYYKKKKKAVVEKEKSFFKGEVYCRNVE